MRLKRGSTIRIIEDIGCIPCGVYKVMEHDDQFLRLRCGKKITLGVPVECMDKVRVISKKRFIRTSAEEFKRRYIRLLNIVRMTARQQDIPMTYCSVPEGFFGKQDDLPFVTTRL